MRWSSSLMPDCRLSRYNAVPKASTVTASATVYQRVSRRRIVVISDLHDVPNASNCVHQLLSMRGVHLLAQPVDDHVDDVGSGIEVVVPGVFGNQRPRHDSARVPHE